MATICDACGQKYGRDSGSANLHVSPPMPDPKLFGALIETGQLYEPRAPQTLDLCLACARKTLAHLGLSTDVCDLPRPREAAEDDPLQQPDTGALTDEDLRKLGLLEPGADAKT